MRDVLSLASVPPDPSEWKNPHGLLHAILRQGDEEVLWAAGERAVRIDPALRRRVRAACGAYLTEPWIMVRPWVALAWGLRKREPWMSVVRVGERPENLAAFCAAMDALAVELRGGPVLRGEVGSDWVNARRRMRELLKALP